MNFVTSAVLFLFAILPLDAPIIAPRASAERSHPSAKDSLEARRAAGEAVQSFILRWRRAWLEGERIRLRKDGDNADRRFHVHCHPPGAQMLIISANRAFAKCPSWLLTDKHPQVDEAEAIDVGISASARRDIHEGRAQLIAILQTLHKQSPRDVFIVGQLVRFAVDAKRFGDAASAADACEADRAWCTALAGYVLASQKRLAEADSVFELVTGLTSASARCDWNDISALLSTRERATYLAMDCEARDRLSSRYWWLARPTMRNIPGANERRAEHFRRKVLGLLHASMPLDEMHDLRVSHGGDAVVEMLMRYGWPTITAWTGDSVDNDHDGYLYAHRVPQVRPYTTAEYSPGRVRFGTLLETVLDPFHADTLSWELRPPLGKAEGKLGNVWRPFEHMKVSAFGVEQLPAGQTALFRRADSIRILAAIDLDRTKKRESRRSKAATLFVSDGPNSVVAVAESRLLDSDRYEFVGAISTRPVVVSIESSPSPTDSTLARTRFGLIPPSLIDTADVSKVSISSPVFFDASQSVDSPKNLVSLARVMLGKTAVPHGGKVGIFWETYGIARSDLVNYSVRISRMESVGLLQKLGAFLRVVDLPTSRISIDWREIEPNRSVSDVDSNRVKASIATGSVVLDVATLSRGNYMIEISADVAHQASARSGRVLTIR
jgi:hypothetical protein